MTSKQAFPIAAVLLGLASLLPAQPDIANNFVTQVTLSSGGSSQQFKLYEWYTGQEVRLDSTDAISNGKNQAFQFWNGEPECSTGSPFRAPRGGGLGYLYEPDNPRTSNLSCSVGALLPPAPATGFWDFLQDGYTQQSGTCSSNGRSGTVWVDTSKALALCANGNTPIALWGAITTQGNTTGADPPIGAIMDFNTFTPGVPAPANFCMPTQCSTPTVQLQLPNGCDGLYWGAIGGDLTVTEGQNCLIFGGAVNGNILQLGGNLVLVATTVNGNVSVLGGGTFSLGAGATIKGDLNIAFLPTSATVSQVCDVNVQGDLIYQFSATPLNIGAASSCGNTVGGSLNVSGNTAAVSVYGNSVSGNAQIVDNSNPVSVVNNAVTGNLACTDDSDITGSGDTAKHQLGQCADF